MTLLEDRRRSASPGPPPEAPPGWLRYAVPAVMVLAAVHAAVVATHYVVGSFDDDGHYLALAHALVSGKGYVDTSVPGAPVDTAYPPGYPALLAPFVWLFGNAVWSLRLLSAVAFVGCVPLLDRLMRRHGLTPGVRLAALLLFALNPAAATFASEVMPETVFLLVLLVVLLALPRWEEQGRLLTWAGAAVALGAPYLVMLKQAGAPMLAGVILWLLLRRHWRQAGVVVAAAVAMALPFVVMRLTAGHVVDSRASGEYALVGSLPHALWRGASLYVRFAIPQTIVPTAGAKLSGHGVALDALVDMVRYSAAALVAVGWVRWLRMRLDPTALIVPLYLLETMPYPYVNERRVVLLVPLVAAWYVLGAVAVGHVLRGRVLPRLGAVRYAAAVPALLLVALLGWQLPRNYLLAQGQSTPKARGSGYVAAVSEMTPAGWTISTGFQWTVSWLTSRPTSNAAHFATTDPLRLVSGCPRGTTPDGVRSVLRRNHVAAVLDADLKWPGITDSACLLRTLSTSTWAVPVYHGSDRSVVFVLLGPGTPRADERPVAVRPSPAGPVAFAPARVAEVSVEVVGPGPLPRLQLHTATGWVDVAATATNARGPRFLHAVIPAGEVATGVRVVGVPASRLRDLVVLTSGRA